MLAQIAHVHTSEIRLTPRGEEQAIQAGEWIRKDFPQGFDSHCVSSFTRARETAALLDLPGARWHQYIDLVERDWGMVESMTAEEYLEMRERLERDGIWGRPKGGETLHQMSIRIKGFIDTLARRFSQKSVVAVCHGEVMWAFRLRLERMTVDQFRALESPKGRDKRKPDLNKINNCQVLHYSRRHPKTGAIGERYDWMRSVCPSDLSLSSNKWQMIERPSFTSSELLEAVREKPRFLS
jgi:broad specificity phosphatase PhoE